MPSYENDQPYGRWSTPPRKQPSWQKPAPKPQAIESVLHSAEMRIERKYFSLQIRENSRGRILRITEEGNGKRNSIIIPASGLRQFQKLLEEMGGDEASILPEGGA